MKEKINRIIEELKIKPVLLNIYGSEGEMYTSLLNSVLISDDSMTIKRKMTAYFPKSDFNSRRNLRFIGFFMCASLPLNLGNGHPLLIEVIAADAAVA